MGDDPLLKRLREEVQPEMDSMLVDHDRFMRLVAKMPEPSEADKRAIAEMNSPAGWRRALEEVTDEVQGRRRRATRRWLLAAALFAAMGILIGILALR